MIKKEKVLVRDNKGVFLKMFKRKFKNEFEFSEDSFLLENESKPNNFDRSIFVVYDKAELLEFLKLEKKGTNVMVCLFNKQLHNSFSFFKDIKNLFLIDGSKTRTETEFHQKSPRKRTQHYDDRRWTERCRSFGAKQCGNFHL